MQNAEKSGLDLVKENSDILILSGTDCTEIVNLAKKKLSTREKIKNFFKSFKLFKSTVNTPQHLQELDFVNKQVKNAEKELYNALNINEFKRLNSIQELVFELAKEK